MTPQHTEKSTHLIIVRKTGEISDKLTDMIVVGYDSIKKHLWAALSVNAQEIKTMIIKRKPVDADAKIKIWNYFNLNTS